MPTGNVKWFDTKKGFGFIVGPEGRDVFVHFSSIEGDGFRLLKDGEAVDYDIQQRQGLFRQPRQAIGGSEQLRAGTATAVKVKV